MKLLYQQKRFEYKSLRTLFEAAWVRYKCEVVRDIINREGVIPGGLESLGALHRMNKNFGTKPEASADALTHAAATKEK